MKNTDVILNAGPGTAVSIEPDYFVLTDGEAAKALDYLKGRAPAHRDRVKVFIDHETPCGSELHAGKQRALINYALEQGCQLYNGRGTSYQLMLEEHVKAGDVVVHCGDFGSIFGSTAAMGFRLSPEKLAEAIVSGKIEIEVPRQLRLEIKGELNSAACAKDAALCALPMLRAGEDKLLLVGGSGLKSLNVSERIAFFQMLSACGCMAAISAGFDNNADVEMELGQVLPTVSGPNDLTKAVPAEKLSAIDISAVFIGGCSCGRIEDIREAVRVINGRHVRRKVRTTVAFASTKVYIQAANEGLISSLLDAGVVVMNQGCSGCYAHSQALVDSRDVVLSAGSRECPDCTGKGRVPTYLCSAATAMESAIRGYICPAGN